MSDDAFRRLIERGDADGVRDALIRDPGLAQRTIRWELNQVNESDPLHYVSDCVAQGWLTNGREAEIAQLLLAAGAGVDGSAGRESPLIAAASLGAHEVARVLVGAGAALEPKALFGARALHWAAWTGALPTVELLIGAGAEIDPRCAEFGATPLFWSVHGYGPKGPRDKRGQVAAARALLDAGADPATENREGVSALAMSQRGAGPDMTELLAAALSRRA